MLPPLGKPRMQRRFPRVFVGVLLGLRSSERKSSPVRWRRCQAAVTLLQDLIESVVVGLSANRKLRFRRSRGVPGRLVVRDNPDRSMNPDNTITISAGPRMRTALLLAIVADAFQIVCSPLLFEGAASPADDFLDLCMAAGPELPSGLALGIPALVSWQAGAWGGLGASLDAGCWERLPEIEAGRAHCGRKSRKCDRVARAIMSGSLDV